MRVEERTGSGKNELEVLKPGVKLVKKQDGVLHLLENVEETLDWTLLVFWILVKMLTYHIEDC